MERCHHFKKVCFIRTSSACFRIRLLNQYRFWISSHFPRFLICRLCRNQIGQWRKRRGGKLNQFSSFFPFSVFFCEMRNPTTSSFSKPKRLEQILTSFLRPGDDTLENQRNVYMCFVFPHVNFPPTRINNLTIVVGFPVLFVPWVDLNHVVIWDLLFHNLSSGFVLQVEDNLGRFKTDLLKPCEWLGHSSHSFMTRACNGMNDVGLSQYALARMKSEKVLRIYWPGSKLFGISRQTTSCILRSFPGKIKS